MANPIQHAKKTSERVHEAIRPYMPSVFQALALNYSILVIVVALINTVGVWALLRFFPLPTSTVNVISFAVNLLFLLYGWRFLENRNNATAIFALYTRYSRQRRDLQAVVKQAENKTLDNEDTVYVQVDILEETATQFLEAVEAQGVKAYEAE